VSLGRFVGFEGKTGRGQLTIEQRRWHSLVRSMGGFATEFRSVDDARAGLARARMGMSS
jgi:hypothetical protein